jgi:hypothetical protein
MPTLQIPNKIQGQLFKEWHDTDALIGVRLRYDLTLAVSPQLQIRPFILRILGGNVPMFLIRDLPIYPENVADLHHIQRLFQFHPMPPLEHLTQLLNNEYQLPEGASLC